MQSVVSVPIIWSLQGAASPVVEDDPPSRLVAEYGVAAWRAHPARASWGETWCLIGSWDVEGGGGQRGPLLPHQVQVFHCLEHSFWLQSGEVWQKHDIDHDYFSVSLNQLTRLFKNLCSSTSGSSIWSSFLMVPSISAARESWRGTPKHDEVLCSSWDNVRPLTGDI